MKKGDTLFLVHTFDEQRVKLVRHQVTSVMRQPRRGPLRHFLSPRERRVYLVSVERYPWRQSVPLDGWQRRGFATTPRAAWRRSLPRIRRKIALLEEVLQEEEDAETRAELRLQRGNLTRAIRKAR